MKNINKNVEKRLAQSAASYVISIIEKAQAEVMKAKNMARNERLSGTAELLDQAYKALSMAREEADEEGSPPKNSVRIR
jgi:hypothetical protein